MVTKSRAMSERIVVAGCGDVGGRAAIELAARGHTVFGLRRRWHATPPGVVPIEADLTDPRTFATVPRDITQLVYCPTPSERSEAGYRQIYLDGLRHLLEHLEGDVLQRLLFVSSTAVYGQNDGQWVDETSATEPARFNGRVLLEAEQAVAQVAATPIVLRLSGIYGPGRHFLINKVRAGTRCQPQAFTNRIHVDDAAASIVHLLALEEPASCYIGVDNQPVGQCQVMQFLAGLLDAPRPEPDLAASPSNKRCRNARLIESGFELRYPSYREGFPQVLAKMSST